MQLKRTLQLPSQHLLTLVCSGLLLFGSACSNQTSISSSENDTAQQTEKSIVVASFASDVVVPTYEKLVVKANNLSTAVDAFVSNPNNDTLKAAQEAWIAARFPWERSEAFAFGPADSLGYDGDLDDWPVNETDVVAVLKSSDKFSPEYIKGLQTTQKGFHTIELLLFGNDNNKQAGNFSPRELELVKSLARAFQDTADELLISWVDGVAGNPPYQEVFASAGDSSNPAYPTVGAAMEEIVQGMIGCLDEVANEKIGEPLETKSTEGLESRFSNSSLNDFKHNIHSVRNAYLGSLDGSAAATSLSSWVAKQNPELDQQLKSELNAAIASLEAIPTPIEQKITDTQALAKMADAQDKILTVFTTVEGKVLPLVQS